jgi:hypothetical protein
MEFNDRLTVGIAAIAIAAFMYGMTCAIVAEHDRDIDYALLDYKQPVAASVEARPLYYTVRVVIPHDTVSICTDFIPAHGATIQADQITGTVISVRALEVN